MRGQMAEAVAFGLEHAPRPVVTIVRSPPGLDQHYPVVKARLFQQMHCQA
jgi:hypothetical protein